MWVLYYFSFQYLIIIIIFIKYLHIYFIQHNLCWINWIEFYFLEDKTHCVIIFWNQLHLHFYLHLNKKKFKFNSFFQSYCYSIFIVAASNSSIIFINLFMINLNFIKWSLILKICLICQGYIRLIIFIDWHLFIIINTFQVNN